MIEIDPMEFLYEADRVAEIILARFSQETLKEGFDYIELESETFISKDGELIGYYKNDFHNHYPSKLLNKNLLFGIICYYKCLDLNDYETEICDTYLKFIEDEALH